MELPDYVYNPAAPSIYAICQIITKNFLFVNIFLEYFEAFGGNERTVFVRGL